MRQVLNEYESIEIDIPQRTADQLVTRHREHVDVSPSGEGPWRITAKQFVGSLSVDDLTILIRPKVGIRNLLALMDIEIPSETWRDEVVPLGGVDDVLQAMARLFCVAVENTTRRGVRRSYVEMRERLVAPRGRIDVREIVRQPGIESPIACTFDEHTPDIPINQILFAALAQARRIRGLGPRWQQRLLLQQAQFEDVSLLRDEWSWVKHWEPSPMELHYATSVRLAHLLLSGSSLNTRLGDTSSNSFLLNMNDLFEKWVHKRLAEYCTFHQVEAQATVSLGEERAVRMNPDIVFWDARGTRCVAVADAKYKLLYGGEGRSSDYYQALAYGTAYNLPESWLIYARWPGQPVERDVIVKHTGMKLRTVGIDMTQDVAGITAQVHRAADQILTPSQAAATC